MSLAELTASRLPRHTGRSSKRPVRRARTGLARTIRRLYRKLLRTLTVWHRRQYYLTAAYLDIRKAVARNEDIFFASSLIAAAVMFAFAATASQVFLQSFLSLSLLNDLTGFSFLPVFVLFCGVLATLAGWVAAWMANLLSTALMDGANRKRTASLRRTLRHSLQQASRTTSSWLLVAVVVGGPMVLVGLLSMLYLLLLSDRSLIAAGQAMALAVSASVMWLLYAGTTYGLAPQVALFEKDVPLWSTLGRSRQLVLRRGRPFIMGLYVAAGVFIAGAYSVAWWLQQAFSSTIMVFFYGVVFATLCAVRLGMSVLYRKRKLARVR